MPKSPLTDKQKSDKKQKDNLHGEMSEHLKEIFKVS